MIAYIALGLSILALILSMPSLVLGLGAYRGLRAMKRGRYRPRLGGLS